MRITEYGNVRVRRTRSNVVVGRIQKTWQLVLDEGVGVVDRAIAWEVPGRAVDDHGAETGVVAADRDRDQIGGAVQRPELIAVDIRRLRAATRLEVQRVAALRGDLRCVR